MKYFKKYVYLLPVTDDGFRKLHLVKALSIEDAKRVVKQEYNGVDIHGEIFTLRTWKMKKLDEVKGYVFPLKTLYQQF